MLHLGTFFIAVAHPDVDGFKEFADIIGSKPKIITPI
jgi:hypothetical protein